ncbi:LysM peptidoglycan-binding domain-containing protein [Lachnospiraceae bacterium ZAX-1]
MKGDSLWGIAQKLLGNGTRYTEIVKLNALTSNTIYSGQKLKIPN